MYCARSAVSHLKTKISTTIPRLRSLLLWKSLKWLSVRSRMLLSLNGSFTTETRFKRCTSHSVDVATEDTVVIVMFHFHLQIRSLSSSQSCSLSDPLSKWSSKSSFSSFEVLSVTLVLINWILRNLKTPSLLCLNGEVLRRKLIPQLKRFKRTATKNTSCKSRTVF